MKVLVLGGAGSMGLGGTTLMLHYPEIESVVLADLNLEAAEKAAAEFDSPRVTAMQLDITDREKLIATAKQFDVVLNAVGPFTIFGKPILEAVIEAGVNYVDVCDDHDAASDLLSLDEKAKEAGITALICMGTTPGIANVQARYVADMLDSVDTLKICWAITDPPGMEGSGADMISGAAWNHLIHVASGEVPIWKNGKWDTMPALESGEYVDFAEPLGRAEAYFIGHAEPVTLPRTIKINDFCACLGSLMPEVTKKLRMDARGHEDPMDPPVRPDTPVWQSPQRWIDRNVWGGQAAIAEGTKDGKRMRYTARLMMGVADMLPYNNTGQAIGVYMVGTGQVNRKGVVTPEECLDPTPFFKELARHYTLFCKEDFAPEEVILLQEETL